MNDDEITQIRIVVIHQTLIKFLHNNNLMKLNLNLEFSRYEDTKPLFNAICKHYNIEYLDFVNIMMKSTLSIEQKQELYQIMQKTKKEEIIHELINSLFLIDWNEMKKNQTANEFLNDYTDNYDIELLKKFEAI